MGKHEKKFLKFLAKYPNKWHTFASNHATVSLVCALHNRGDALVNGYDQIRSTSQGIRNVGTLA